MTALEYVLAALKIALVAIAIVNPFIVTAVVMGAAAFLLKKDVLRPFRLRILIGALAAFAIYAAIDSAFAYRRVQFGNAISSAPVVSSQIPMPKSIVLVNSSCDQACLGRLADGVHDEVTYISTTRFDRNVRVQIDPPYAAVRYSLVSANAGACPSDPERTAERLWTTAAVDRLRARGLCPRIEPVTAPSEGVFIVDEGWRAAAFQRAAPFTPRFLTVAPPGRVILFAGIEVQKRAGHKVDVLGSFYRYSAPGFLGLPPLLGCWDRPDNILWIMPPGDTGCGFWRLMTSKNEGGHYGDVGWVYSRLFK